MENIRVVIENANQSVCSSSPMVTNDGLYLTFPCAVPPNSGVLSSPLTIIPQKRIDPGNGLPTDPIRGDDIILIRDHILNLVPLSNAYKMVAADANNSGTITTLDIVEIRRIILGITSDFPSGSWRYLPQYCMLDPTFISEFDDDNPFDASWYSPVLRTNLKYPDWLDKVNVVPSSSEAELIEPWSFQAIKVGDVNCSAFVHSTSKLYVDAYPSPFSEHVSFRFVTDQDKFVQLNVFDITGRIVARKEINLSKGNQTVSLTDSGSLYSGLYYYTVEWQNGLLQGKFSKK